MTPGPKYCVLSGNPMSNNSRKFWFSLKYWQSINYLTKQNIVGMYNCWKAYNLVSVFNDGVKVRGEIYGQSLKHDSFKFDPDMPVILKDCQYTRKQNLRKLLWRPIPIRTLSVSLAFQNGGKITNWFYIIVELSFFSAINCFLVCILGK